MCRQQAPDTHSLTTCLISFCILGITKSDSIVFHICGKNCHSGLLGAVVSSAQACLFSPVSSLCLSVCAALAVSTSFQLVFTVGVRGKRHFATNVRVWYLRLLGLARTAPLHESFVKTLLHLLCSYVKKASDHTNFAINCCDDGIHSHKFARVV